VQDDGSVTVDLSADNDINITTTGNVVVDSDTVNVTAATEAVVNSDTVNVTAATEAVVDSPTVKLGGDTGTEVVARKGDIVETSDPLTGTNAGTITSGATNTEAK
jgi:phage gp45-like